MLEIFVCEAMLLHFFTHEVNLLVELSEKINKFITFIALHKLRKCHDQCWLF